MPQRPAFLRAAAALAVLFASLIAAPGVGAERQSAPAIADRVAGLIEQLGAPKYIARQAARQELRSLGLAAFDQLLVASGHPDPEVAAASQRLLETMTVRWTRPGDPPEVRRLLQNYGEAELRERRAAAHQLRDLPDEQGFAALCRLVRFESSERLSREAAMLAMTYSAYAVPPARIAALAEGDRALSAEYGPSQRAAGEWLRLFVQQTKAPAETLDAWRRAADAEQRSVDERQAFTDDSMVDALRWNWLRAQLAAGAADALPETIDKLTEVDPRRAESALTKALEWMVDAGADAGVDDLLESRRDQLTTKRGLYLAAAIRQKQGRPDAAEELAEQAFQAPPLEEDALRIDNRVALDGRVRAGTRVEINGHTEWAIREYAEAARLTPDLSINSIYARWRLSNLLLDHERYGEGADELAASVGAIERDAKSRVLFRHYREQFDRLPSTEAQIARRDYLLALAARAAKDWDAEVRHLKTAIEADPSDADILIAMHRARGGDDAFRQETLDRIKTLADETEQIIQEQPEDPLPYNQWAWLISNTVGDYAKAIRYSEKSLELQRGADGTEDPGFLDTLGRCYYAIGDYERAVEKQRRAVEQQPHVLVMQRQLELFEEALAQSRNEPRNETPAP